MPNLLHKESIETAEDIKKWRETTKLKALKIAPIALYNHINDRFKYITEYDLKEVK